MSITPHLEVCTVVCIRVCIIVCSEVCVDVCRVVVALWTVSGPHNRNVLHRNEAFSMASGLDIARTQILCNHDEV